MILMRKGRSPREQVERYHARKAFEREKKAGEFIKEANRMRERLKEYRLDDPCNLGIDRGYIEFFNGKLRDELFNRGVFATLAEVKILTEVWRNDYNETRPYSALGY